MLDFIGDRINHFAILHLLALSLLLDLLHVGYERCRKLREQLVLLGKRGAHDRLDGLVYEGGIHDNGLRRSIHGMISIVRSNWRNRLRWRWNVISGVRIHAWMARIDRGSLSDEVGYECLARIKPR